MGKDLVIVESPAKAKTIGKMLGRKYKVLASVGHVRDLPKSRLGVDLEDNFEPGYINIRGKGPIINELRKAGKKADKIYLATDPDREGEAISWHLAYILGIDEEEKSRVEFNEVTKTAVKKAMENPREIDQDLVDAQQARRILDRLVGYQISPLLWKKIRRGLSAGRVQSVATKMICDREEEIDAFIAEEYWSIKSLVDKDNKQFEANFYGKKQAAKLEKIELSNEEEVKEVINNLDKDKFLVDKDNKQFEANFHGRKKANKLEKIELNNEEEVKEIINNLDKDKFLVDKVTKGQRRRNPYKPYTTSTMQQDISKRLGFSTKKTMAVAQQLYEGIAIKGEGTTGLITYMRTDSNRISDEAIKGSKAFILENYGEEFYNGGKSFGKKGKSDSQDAHEAIRPTRFDLSPKKLEGSLTKDQFRLYELIWNRLIASQMTAAVYNTLRVDINSNDYIFRATGRNLIFPGFLEIYSIDDNEKEIDMPELVEQDKLKVNKIEPNQHFTQPPGRYSEASLIKALEENGIGRPSTYSPTIGTILARNYVVLENKNFEPTELGILVNDLLIEYFGEVINEEFTAELESGLDNVAEGEMEWKSIVAEFYKDFEKYLKVAEEEIQEVKIEDEETDIVCDKCGEHNMVIKMGRFGKFLACPGYPDCKNTKTILDKIGVDCPECGGDIIRKKTRKGRTFYGCSNYPDCEFAAWQEPSKEKCEKCDSLMVIKRSKSGNKLQCINEDCKFERKEKEE